MKTANKVFISCREATYLHEKKKAGKTSVLETIALSIHLLYCRLCRLFIKQTNQLEAYTQKLSKIRERQNAYSSSGKAELERAFGETLKKE